MQLPVKAHYAALAMLHLARDCATGQLAPARTIASEQKIPSQFLGQILQQLRASGLITSTRGSCGGFQLSRSANTISLADIVESVCPGSSEPPELGNDGQFGDTLSEVWAELHQTQRDVLTNMSLADLLSRASSDASAMFYI